MSLKDLAHALLPQPGVLPPERAWAEVQVFNVTTAKLSRYRKNLTLKFDKLDDDAPKLLDVTDGNALGGQGTFSFGMWVPPGVWADRIIAPNAWVLISHCRGPKKWLTQIGMVDDVQISLGVEGNGATAQKCRVTGRSFQKAWAETPLFFNKFGGENPNVATYRAIASGRINGTPTDNLKAILFNLFAEIGALHRANWSMPPGMPGKKGTLNEVVVFDDSGFDHKRLSRFTPTGQQNFPEAKIWDVAQQYMDGSHCELWCDVMPPGGLTELARNPDQSSGLDASVARMTLCFRDKPFPVADPTGQGDLLAAGPWFKLPTWKVPVQSVVSIQMVLSDRDCFNAFLNVGNFGQETVASAAAIRAPLWRPDDMDGRGMRRMDTTGPYRANNLAGVLPGPYIQARRARLRDWYTMGEDLMSGSVTLWRVHPEIRVGGRLRIAFDRGVDQLTGYVESVRHQWSPNGGRTVVQLTRIWRGTDDALLKRLTALSADFVPAGGPGL